LPRERVIVEIENLGQAAKIEDTVKTGYCDTIKDNLVHWIAVEEDIIDSYQRMSEKVDPTIASRMKDFVRESEGNIATLRETLKSFEILGQQKMSRALMLRDMESAGSSR
jgi:bacterioferritin (cytochrome b1)